MVRMLVLLKVATWRHLKVALLAASAAARQALEPIAAVYHIKYLACFASAAGSKLAAGHERFLPICLLAAFANGRQRRCVVLKHCLRVLLVIILVVRRVILLACHVAAAHAELRCLQEILSVVLMQLVGEMLVLVVLVH